MRRSLSPIIRRWRIPISKARRSPASSATVCSSMTTTLVAFSMRSPTPTLRRTQSLCGRATTGHHRLRPSRLGGRLATPVRGAARSAPYWKEISALPASSAGPGIPCGQVSNEIVAILDFFPTLARAAGGTMPTDRPIDGVDQLDFFTGEREASNREHVLLFLGQRLMAVKWRHYKIHLDGLERVDGVIEDWSFPRAFNLASDPKERWNIIWQNSWIGDEIGAFIAAYGASVRQYPNVASAQPNEPPPRPGAGNVVADEGKPQHG